MRNLQDPKVTVPGDGYCGLHACLVHTLLATQFMNSSQSHTDFTAMRDALLACKDDIDALPDNAVEFFRLGSSSLPTRMHDIFSEFPAWQRAWRAQLDTQEGVSKAILLKYYAEHLDNLNAFCAYSAPGALDGSDFFRAWRDAYEQGPYAPESDNSSTFSEALADYAAIFVSGSIRDSYHDDPTYLNLFGSFCQAYANSTTRQREQNERINFMNGGEEAISFHFDELFAYFNDTLGSGSNPFEIGAPQTYWLGDEDVRLILDRTVMPNCNFEFVGLNASNPSRVHWEVTASNGFMRSTPSLDWANRQRALVYCNTKVDAQPFRGAYSPQVDFSLLPLSAGIVVFTEAIRDIVDLQTGSASFWDTPKKMKTLQDAETRLSEEIQAFEIACNTGRLDLAEDEVEDLSVAVENMRVAIDDFRMTYAALDQEYARFNILLKICIWIRDKVMQMIDKVMQRIDKVDDSMGGLDSPVAMVTCQA